MLNNRNIRSNALRLAALASVSMVALPAHAADASTQAGPQKSLLGGVTGAGSTLVGGLLGGATTGPKAEVVKPMYGNLRPFYGNLRPFYGNLRPFYGNLRPFWGNLRPFWGETSAFYGDFKLFWGTSNPVVGAGAPQYDRVGDYWTAAGDDWNQIFTQWNSQPSSASAGAYKPIADQLKEMLADGRTFWGSSIQAQTGKSFDAAFATPLLKKYGIDLAKPGSLGELDQTERAMFFLEYYDGLMNFTGTDHADHWMKTVNWTPALTRTQGAGADVRIGILDQSIGKLPVGQVLQYRGTSEFTDGHGAAVASLIVGAHDGKGVMGMAPNAKVFAYNPFDSTGTANWDDVTVGVQKLKASGAGVVNMSLGVPGSTFDPGWNHVFTDLRVLLTLKSTVFVVAAGNEGATQTRNVEWLPLNPAVIVVGSVDVEGNISNFSNRPGDACLTLLSLCLPGNKLMHRFIVAPGELILVSDGQGGTTRQIGTSFAAPLVSGAVALLHDRWPWLVNHPGETADTILGSAKDLGAPGTDGVYGRGLLDVEASQSPLDFNQLVWFTVENGQKKLQTRGQVLNSYQAAQQTTWDAKNAYYYAFEMIGLTNRDFAIPLSQKLIGQSVTTSNGSKEQFQAYLLDRMDDWARSQFSQTPDVAARANGFFPLSVPMATTPWGADMTMSFAPRTARYGFRDEGPAFQSAMKIRNERTTMTFGFGDGAAALSAQPGFTLAADYDVEKGGANPLLGLASGGVYAGWTYDLSDKLSFTTNVLQREQERDRGTLAALGVPGNGASTYEAGAQQVAMSYRPSVNVTLSGSYTRLTEATGILGVQSFDANDFRKGSTTDGLTLGFAWQAGSKLTLAASGTMGRTHSPDDGQAIKVDKGGLTTSAFQASVARADLFAKGDVARFTLAQPLHVERGRLAADTVAIVDRSTGEIGIVRQGFDVTDQRRLAAEMLYAVPVQKGLSEVSLFGRVEGEMGGGNDTTFLSGARYRLAF